MDILQAYILLFNDSFLTGLLVVPRLPYVIDVMVNLGTYNNYLILIVSLIANIAALILNWIIGLLFRKIENLEKFANRSEVFKNAEIFFATKGKWILLFSAIPLWGPLFTTAAGVLRLNLVHFIILVSFSEFIALSIRIFF